MRSKIHAYQIWNEFREVPAMHAAVTVFAFFCAVFLNFGWMLVVLAAYVLLAIRSLSSRRRPIASYVQCLSLESSVLLFGVLYDVCFHAWMPVLPSFAPIYRTLSWLMLAFVLVSVKFFLITRFADALSDERWYERALESTSALLLSFVFLIASLGVFLLAQFGPGAGDIPFLILRSLTPGIL